MVEKYIHSQLVVLFTIHDSTLFFPAFLTCCVTPARQVKCQNPTESSLDAQRNGLYRFDPVETIRETAVL